MPPGRAEKVSLDFKYLTTDLPSLKRLQVINGDEEAHERTNEFKEAIENFIQEIEHLYYIENKEPPEIADHFFHQQGQHENGSSEKQEIIDYIDKVIEVNSKNN